MMEVATVQKRSWEHWSSVFVKHRALRVDSSRETNLQEQEGSCTSGLQPQRPFSLNHKLTLYPVQVVSSLNSHSHSTINRHCILYKWSPASIAILAQPKTLYPVQVISSLNSYFCSTINRLCIQYKWSPASTAILAQP